MSGDAHVIERAELSLASLLRHFPVAVLDAAVEP
jgi:hypothetical protein